MSEADSVNFLHKYLGQIITGIGILVLWALKTLGARVLDQYVTEKKLYRILKEHSDAVKEERKKEQQAFEDRLFIRLVKALKK